MGNLWIEIRGFFRALSRQEVLPSKLPKLRIWKLNEYQEKKMDSSTKTIHSHNFKNYLAEIKRKHKVTVIR